MEKGEDVSYVVGPCDIIFNHNSSVYDTVYLLMINEERMNCVMTQNRAIIMMILKKIRSGEVSEICEKNEAVVVRASVQPLFVCRHFRGCHGPNKNNENKQNKEERNTEYSKTHTVRPLTTRPETIK
jgi:hypothetical protein